ncbi:hypothetical protein CRYUN_Cryun26dG0062200 [Craigia yunnanensis]
MAARKHSDDRKFCSIGKQQFVIFDCSNHFITAFCSRPEHHYGMFDRLKRVAAAHALENTRARKRILDTVIDDSIQFKEEISGEDSDGKSDAESLPWSQRDLATEVLDYEQCLNNLFHDEGTRKKLKVLGGMVGAPAWNLGLCWPKW